MFCGNCGAENTDEASFCKACGKPLGKVTKRPAKQSEPYAGATAGSSAESGNTNNSALQQFKAIPKKFVVGACAAVVLIIVIICIGVNRGSTINLNDYLVVETDGYDGYGTARISVDWNAITEKYGKKIAYTSQAQSEYGGIIKLMTPADVLQDCVSVRLEETSGLANGEEIPYTWEVDAKLSEMLKCKVKYEDDIYRISGLTEVGTFDAFADLQVEFNGIAPNGTVNINYNGPGLSTYYFSCDKTNGLSNGDTVTISIDESNLAYCIESMGQVPEKLEQEYLVEGLSSYISQISEVNETGLSAMQQQASDVYKAYVAQRWDDSQEKLETFTYIGNYLLTSKNNDSYRANELYMVFKVQVRNNYTYEGDHYNKLNDIYWYICYENVMTDSDGNLTIDITNCSTPYDEFTVDSGIGGWWTQRWNYKGYQTLDDLYKTVVLSNMDAYNHEDNIDESAAPEKTETLVEETETLDREGYIIPNSDKELLTEESLEGLSAEECKIARNEIYARHGRKFKDEGLQAHFDSCDWYDGRIEPDDFNESELSEIEIANKDLISAYEKEKGYK